MLVHKQIHPLQVITRQERMGVALLGLGVYIRLKPFIVCWHLLVTVTAIFVAARRENYVCQGSMNFLSTPPPTILYSHGNAEARSPVKSGRG